MIVKAGMPEVSRSDSQRSDASQKPRVSFNRDVHVKRIVPRENSSIVSGAVSGDGRVTPLIATPIKKERLKKSKKELAEEAKRVLHQVDRVDCITSPKGVNPQKYYTLQNRKKKKEYFSGSLDRRTKRRNSLELLPPKKPPRTFAATKYSQKSSIFDIFKKDKPIAPKKSSLRRSTSDLTHNDLKNNDKFRKRSGSDSEEILKRRSEKKQLSPIIEVTQREDYFSAPELNYDNNKENVEPKGFVRKKKKESVIEQLKQFIDEVDEELYKETGVRVPPPEEQKPPQPIIIDVDKAKPISTKGKKFKSSILAKKFKSITQKKKNTNEANKTKKSLQNKIKEVQLPVQTKAVKDNQVDTGPGPIIKEAIKNLEHPENTPKMIHSSQMPAEKLPLTKGRTVNSMVQRLSNDPTSPPPLKSNVTVTPHPTVQHNNNQPFSYTRGLSPDKYETSPTPGSPIIYAQVVCGNNSLKQTVHTNYGNGKRHAHSDSDEGLGGEEHLGFKTVTRFGEDYDGLEKFEEESPITPKFRNPAYLNGYSSYERQETSNVRYIDSSARGRGDGMDSKRRESLTEPHENVFTSTTLLNGRSDLSARRDQLESRINRRVNDNSLRTSPEYLKNPYPTNVYIAETTSKHYVGGSSSPVGYTEKYKSETRPDKYGKPQTKESRTMQYFGGDHRDRIEYEHRLKPNGYQYNGYEVEPKSFDSQISSSPENRRYETNYTYKRDEHRTFKSTPDISYRSQQDSLKRENIERRTGSSNYRSEYLEDNDRRERFVDSGIENDFRRDSGEHFRTRPNHRRDYCNESEDEGFASSLLIASERQHTEDNINNRKRHDYDSDRAVSREDDPYKNVESMKYKSKLRSNEYIPRERSIDDGSHYDPRIDKDVEVFTLRRSEKKPPKPEKKSGLEKVKSLFSRDTKKKKEKVAMVREESLRARYVEYKGKNEPVEPKYKKQEVKNQMSYDYNDRRRFSTPSPSPTRDQSNGKSESTHGSWFKSLDRLSRKKPKKGEKESNFASGTEEETPTKPTKNLRFFGDTDQESNESLRQKTSTKTRTGTPSRSRSHSTRELHATEHFKSPRNGYKNTISESEKENKAKISNLKPPMSPNHRIPRDVSRQDRDRSRRRKNEVSSVESSTEGDSSQQSQRSIVYLHAATVGDIPGPGYLKNGRRAASREELASNGSRVQQVKTLSRSFSVLAPWKPRNPRDGMDIDYTQHQKNGKFEQKISKNSSSRKDSSSTLKKKAQESRKNHQNGSTLLKLSKSKENLASQTLRRSGEDLSKGSNSTLYKKKDRLPKENSRYNREREDKKIASKSLSVESLGGQERRNRDRDISRSVSMPRDPEKSAGWFKVSKKNKMGSTQRL